MCNTFSNGSARKLRALIDEHVSRIIVYPDKLVMELSRNAADSQLPSRIEVPWTKATATRRREILLPASQAGRQRSSNSVRKPSAPNNGYCERTPLAPRAYRGSEGER